MNDDGKTYESQLSIKDLNIVQGVIDTALGNVISLSDGQNLISLDIATIPFMRMVDLANKMDSEEEFSEACKKEAEVLFFALTPGEFHGLLFRMIAHGIEETPLQKETMKVISEGVRIGAKNARNEGDK